MHKELITEITKFKDGRVWETKKCRMNAEDRYLRYDIWSQVALNLYSVSMLALSVITVYRPDDSFDLYNLILSILLLGVTLIVSCLKLKEAANDYKTSYTRIILIEDKLEYLINCIRDEIHLSDPHKEYLDIRNDYQRVIEQTSNHKIIDFHKMKKNTNKLKGHSMFVYNLKMVLEYLIFGLILLFPLLLIIYKLKGLY